jgi:5-methyltetrahydrofolate--homocysteine methyltransferase
VVADGSTGSALELLSPGAGNRAALLPLEAPELVASLHRAYFEAGSELVETATFQASSRGLRSLFPDEVDDADGFAYRVNRAAAELAACEARAAEARGGPGCLRWVAGSMGPGDEPPSLGASTWSGLFESYLPQARGFADGGCDLAIIETCQDPLQAKAAIAALLDPRGGAGLPFIVSATVDAAGRLLAGTSIEAFVAIIAPFGPLALGLNCSGGPEELGPVLERLAAASPFPVSFMPNAGLPREAAGKTVWPLGPDEFAQRVDALVRGRGVALAGGCCGTLPAHIAALAARLGPLAARPRPAIPKARRPALASLYEEAPIGPGLLRIGEKANSAGSAAFSALIEAGDFDGAAVRAVAQEGKGAAALDLHVSRPGRDEAADLAALVSRLSGLARSALCLDSGSPEVLGAALPFAGGRPLINSTSLEDPDRARKVFALARRFGAAVVCLAMDASGPAADAASKAAICRKLYDIATGEFALEPSALFFDPLTFTLAAGKPGSAAETLAALGLIHAACPGSFTVLGVGNISYGLPRPMRPAVTAVFLDLAVRAGLDAAILDAGGLPEVSAVKPGIRRAVECLVEGKAEEGFDALAVLLGSEPGPSGKTTERSGITRSDAPGSAGREASSPEARPGPELRLGDALLHGDRRAAEAAAREIIASYGDATSCGDAVAAGAAAATRAVTETMSRAGELWNAGDLPLPLVLRAAESARAVLALVAAEAGEGAAAHRGNVVVATVKGDLHDIGKNIAGAIIACSGYRIIDLGTDVPRGAILEAARREKAVAIGLSGLLTKSLAEMAALCGELAAAESAAGAASGFPDGRLPLVLAGGAAVDGAWVSRVLEPLLPGRVKACPDAFEGIAFLESRCAPAGPLAAAVRPASGVTGVTGAAEGAPPHKAGAAIAARSAPAFEPPRLGSGPGACPVEDLGFDEIVNYMDRTTLFTARWKYGKAGFGEAEARLAELLDEVRARGLLEAKAVAGFFRCRRVGETGLAVEAPGGGESLFDFPVEAAEPHRCLAQYFAPEDALAAFAVTIGPRLPEAARALRSAGRLEDYWRLHGLGSALAEACAELVHARLGTGLAAAGAGTAGRRYSFGFPSCPGLEAQGPLLSLLGAERAGIGLTGGFQLSPEHSVTAIIIARNDAEYFTA